MQLLPKIQDSLDEREVIKLKNKVESLKKDLEEIQQEFTESQLHVLEKRDIINGLKHKIEELENENKTNIHN